MKCAETLWQRAQLSLTPSEDTLTSWIHHTLSSFPATNTESVKTEASLLCPWARHRALTHLPWHICSLTAGLSQQVTSSATGSWGAESKTSWMTRRHSQQTAWLQQQCYLLIGSLMMWRMKNYNIFNSSFHLSYANSSMRLQPDRAVSLNAHCDDSTSLKLRKYVY